MEAFTTSEPPQGANFDDGNRIMNYSSVYDKNMGY